MITELQKELAQLQSALHDAPSRPSVNLTSLPNASSRIEALEFDQVDEPAISSQLRRNSSPSVLYIRENVS